MQDQYAGRMIQLMSNLRLFAWQNDGNMSQAVQTAYVQLEQL
jgi:hypothetical protein